METPAVPGLSVLWAQRSSATNNRKNFIYLTVRLLEIIHSTLKYTITNTSISLRVNAKEGDQEHEHAFELDFHAEVVPEALEKCITPQSITIVLFKKNMSARHWPHLSKTTLVYVETDFSRWTWEGDESDDVGDGGLTDIISGGLPKQSNQLSVSSVPAPIVPQILWAQRSSPTERMKNIIRISINAPDILESTLKCIVTDTGVSFYACAREGYEECDYAFDLDFYADVIPHVVEQCLTAQCLTIILQKKHMDSQHWPCLSKAGVLPYVKPDFWQWGDESDGIVIERVYIGALRMSFDQLFVQLSELDKHGLFFLRRFDHLGKIVDIQKAVSFLEVAVQLTSDEHVDKPYRLNNLGIMFLRRFEGLQELGDIEKAILSFEGAVQLTLDKHAERPNRLDNLGTALLIRFQHLGELGDVEKAISSLQDAVQLTPDGDKDKPSRLNNLGSSLSCRFKCLGDRGDIEKAIFNLEAAVQLTPDGHVDMPGRLSNLGMSLASCFEHFGEMRDIEKAIFNLEVAVQLTPDRHPDRPVLLNNLGTLLAEHFCQLGEVEDIDKAISSIEEAVWLVPDEHADKSKFLCSLGISLSSRFEQLGEMEDLEKAISSLEKAMQLNPDGHADKPRLFGSLGNSHLRRFKHFGDVGDVEKAILYLEAAVQLVPDRHVDRPGLLGNLGTSFVKRFEWLEEMEDIEKAILNLRNAVQLMPDGHAAKPGQLSNLSGSLLSRFKCLGEMEDIEKAISSLEEAVQLMPDGHADRPSVLGSLGNSLLVRFEHLGEMRDIEKAIMSLEDAVQLTPDGHAAKPIFLSLLGASLSMCFEHHGELGDIEKAVSSLECAVQLTPDGHADRPGYLSNLGNSLLRRFECYGEMEDIEQAISSLEDAVQLTPDGCANKRSRLNNLGNSLSRHFECFQEIGDIGKAILCHQDAMQLMPDGHAGRSSQLNNLGNSLFARFKLSQDPEDLKQSIFATFQSATQSTGPPSVRFRSAISWSQRAHLCHDVSVPSALEAYTTAFTLLPQMSWLGLSIATRHHTLIHARTLACDAAATAISANKLHTALEWVEQGRSVLWGQILGLRTPLDDLQAANPKLAAKLASIAADLERGSSAAFLGDTYGDSKLSPEETVQRHRRLADEWERIVEQVRKLPDFEGFLLPKQYSQLREAACNGPVVVLNASQYGCDALIIVPPLELHRVRLDGLTYEHADSLRNLLYVALNTQGLREERAGRPVPWPLDGNGIFRDLLRQLWELVVEPVLRCLESLQFKDNLHIRWCPTGPLAFLPVHAAGIYNKDGTVLRSLADTVISSYTPSLSALLNSSQRNVNAQSNLELLVVSQSDTPGACPLPGTEKELEYIRRHTSDLRLPSHSLKGGEATVKQVLLAMKQYPWVHFACHGIQDTKDPMKSGLLLSDGLLQLSDIIKETLPNADFAFLSACQTATGDQNRPEEAIHLAAGMLLAGYRSVVATMWSIQDNVAPFIANEVYAQLLEDGKPSSAKAAQALHIAVRRVRERPGGCSFASWVPFIHMGV